MSDKEKLELFESELHELVKKHGVEITNEEEGLIEICTHNILDPYEDT
jgi:hypothetical protein